MSANTTASHPSKRFPFTKSRVVGAAVAVPALMLALSAPASAADLTPIAQAVDSTVHSTESTLGAVLDAAGLAA